MTTMRITEDFPDTQSVNDSQDRHGVGDSHLPQPNSTANARCRPAAAPNLPDTHNPLDSHSVRGVGDSHLPQPISRTNAIGSSAAALNLPDTQKGNDSHPGSGVGDSHLPQPTHSPNATARTAAALNLPDTQFISDSHQRCGVGDSATQTTHVTSERQQALGGLGPILADPTLAMAALVVDDLENTRKSNQNRLRSLTQAGLTNLDPDVATLQLIVELITDVETKAVKHLQKVMRRHKLGPWVKSRSGLGDKQAARLLHVLRDPYWNDLTGQPRTLRQLYRYCGMDVVHGKAPSKERGQRVAWNPDARTRIWLIAASCLKQVETNTRQASPYRLVYDTARIQYADATHTVECKRCGPSGKPAPPGSALSDGHKHARAMRLVCKQILKELWLEARRLHEQEIA